LSDSEKYKWLNDSLPVGTGEIRAAGKDRAELVVDWSELVWEPIADE